MDAISSALEFAANKFPDVGLRLDEPMKNHTSLRIGGPVRAMFFPSSKDNPTALCSALREHGAAPYIIGNGTNLLFCDGPLDMVVVKTTGLDTIERTGDTEITAQCGVTLSRLAMFACENGLSGLEFAHGIPGTLGGAVSMNAGAYGGEMKDVVFKTDAYSHETGAYTAEGADHDFSYRESRFTDTGDIILSSVMRLVEGDCGNIRAVMEALSVKRLDKQPLNLPSAGSAFKRPKEGYAAVMIQEAGLKGFTVGGAQVSKKHSGFIVNLGDASFSDMMAVIEHVRETVFKRTGVNLEPEIKIIRNQN